MAAPALRLRGLTKRYGARLALDAVDLDLTAGETLAVLGHNGAGKSTLVRIVCGLERPTSGIVERSHGAIGYCPQHEAYYPELSVRENLKFAAAVQRVPRSLRRPRISGLLDELQLAPHANVRAERLSGGMRRRLGIALALVHAPDLLVVEEPEAGLDPATKLAVTEALNRAAVGRTMLLVTHDPMGLGALADRVATLQEGRIVSLSSQVPTGWAEPVVAVAPSRRSATRASASPSPFLNGQRRGVAS